MLVFGLVFVVAGLAFKLGAVPFHMWVPDVYQGAPTAVTLLHRRGAEARRVRASRSACWSKACCGLAIDWQQMLIVLAVLSLAIGNLAAIAQTNIKRMLAYSTIAHIGFMLLGLLPASSAATRSAGNGYSSAMFYIDHLRADDARHLRHDHAAVARRASRPSSSTTSRA